MENRDFRRDFFSKICNLKAWSSRVDVECFSEHFHEILSSIGVVFSDFRYDFRYFCLRKYCKSRISRCPFGGFRGGSVGAKSRNFGKFEFEGGMI